MTRLILATLAAVAAASAAEAARPAFPSCAQAQAIVAQRGAATIYTAPNTYDRYVAHRGYCAPTQIAQPAFAATFDNPYCAIGATCIEPETEGRRRRW